MDDLSAIVLAAGKGTRMKSDLPKCFHKLAGKPLLEHVLLTLQKMEVSNIFVVVGHEKQVIEKYFKDWPVTFIHQKEQLGTGHAVLVCEEEFKKKMNKNVLILAGDVPLLKSKTLNSLVDFHVKNNSAATDLEKKDANSKELGIKEINTGTFCFDSKKLFEALRQVRADNAQGEYYLTDTIEILKGVGDPVFAFKAADYKETLGVNTPFDLAKLEDLFQ